MQQFFQWTKHTLSQDPRLSGHVNFDGLNDSIWGGFTEAREEKIAIVWHHSHHIRNHDRTKFGILVECFEEIAEGLLSEEYGIEKPTTLEVIFLGEEVQYGKASTNLYIREV
ncbi:RNAse (barnase) inhibitor barstar [Priestia taiwanensis]|uniref:Barstar (barnase inhibitor) domain-containing protein n=2 Tax=Priestia taiwanensis TaxID=1347902 RepID=A0A917ERW4_9BACI|nr:RNAse (barnase) inhibitor barstar [Priestia taiwanensis]GGE71640.1 hypothetical protein GCM10007140_21990 [Priestia taiwanensis]